MLFRVTRICYTIVNAPKGINFALSANDAVREIRHKYGRRWLGAQLEYMHLQPPQKEFLPFYLSRGRIAGTFTASVQYQQTGSVMSANGKQGNSMNSNASYTQTITTAPQPLRSLFSEAQTQLYAGYKYNIRHVHAALRSELLSLRTVAMPAVDTSDATINLFEQSTQTMRELLEQEVRRQATATATAIVRSFHPNASSIAIEFSELRIAVEQVTPVFVPCYVVKARYDEELYTLYVSGLTGTVSGPYLVNALYVARLAGLATLAVFLLTVRNKVAALVFGAMSSVLTYYIAFYIAKYYPSKMRNYYRRRREELRQSNAVRNAQGYRPEVHSSARITEEYHQSSYWDGHAYEQRTDYGRMDESSSREGDANYESSSSSTAGTYSTSRASSKARDPKGYYAILELQGNESINEIRSAYRKQVLKLHPDVGGTTERMSKLNEAYRVLRDPARRAEYDRT